MQTHVRLLHDWIRQLHPLLAGVRATRVTGFALLTLGLLWARSVSLPRIAAALPSTAQVPSTERRLRRWLANAAVPVELVRRPLLTALLAPLAGQELVLTFDPTPHGTRFTLLCLGLVQHRRILPLIWRVVPQQTPWPDRLGPLLTTMVAEVTAALPPGAVVTVVADRGLVGPALIDACQTGGWHLVLRLRAGAGEASKARLGNGREVRLAELVTHPGQRWTAPAAILKGAGWRQGCLTIHWAAGATEPWVLFSDRPGGTARVREYRRRAHAEATYEECKSRGFSLARSKLAATDRLARLLLALSVALWWAHGLGQHVIRAGWRRRFDRSDRRELGLVRLGVLWMQRRLLTGHRPLLPFRQTTTGWRYRWLT